MTEDFTPFYRRSRFWQSIIPWLFFGVFLWIFWSDVVLAWKGWRNLLLILWGSHFSLLNTDYRQQMFLVVGFDNLTAAAMLKVPLNFIFYLVVYWISLFVVAQFILPVHTWAERRMAAKRLRSYFWGRHGPAVFVREGKLVSWAGEEENTLPGVALVDLRSAIVLEQTNPWIVTDDSDAEIAVAPTKSKLAFMPFRRPLFQGDQYPLTRVCGPGINFTEWGERIRNEIDLRPQMRMEPEVKAFTKDGIEIETRVFIGFSLSSPPDVIPVAYVGGNSREDLFGLEIEEKSRGVIVVKGKYNLDPQDAWEIHRQVTSGTAEIGTISRPAVKKDRSSRQSPFKFDEDRIFAAAYGQAYRSSPAEKTQWHELPTVVAAEIFRNHIEQYTYDYLYMLDNPDRLPWSEEIKPEFMRKIKHQGLLSFKLMRPTQASVSQTDSLIGWNLNPLNEKDFGEPILESALESSHPYPLQNTYSKPLRDRGIAVLFAGFSELKPPLAIREKMAERWKAKLDLEIQTINARNEREAMQLINSARTQVQRDATYSLSNLLKQERHSREALALLLFQALQSAATEEKNHEDLPPREILTMMQNLHRWLLVEWAESDAKKKKDGKSPTSPNETAKI